jgi:hypothetical protein
MATTEQFLSSCCNAPFGVGGSALTVSYNTVGAPSTTGANASGTWGINITGNAATATTVNDGTY